MLDRPAISRTARPSRAVIALIIKRTALASSFLGIVLALITITSVIGYHSDYDDPAKRDLLVTKLSADPGIRAIFGAPTTLTTLGGWVGWRSLALAGYIGIAWGVLVAVRMMRGEEESGRWSLLVCGPLTRYRACAAVIVGLGLSLALAWTVLSAVIVGLSFVVHGISILCWLHFTTVLVTAAAIFVAIGIVAAQAVRTERAARTYAAILAAALLIVRVAADSASSLDELRWLTPLGWLEKAQPLADPRIGPLLAAWVLILTLAALSVCAMGHRDIDTGLFPEKKSRSSSDRLLGGVLPMTIRTLGGTACTWIAGGAVMGFVTGLISPSASIALADSKAATQGLSHLGVQTSNPAGYLSMMLLLISAAYTVAAAMQMIATMDEEWSGRAENLLARPVLKVTWLSNRLLTNATALTLMGCTTGVAAWLGSRVRSNDVRIGDMTMAGLNLVPPALFVLAIAALTFGIAPRLVSIVSWTVLVWCFLLRLLSVLTTIPAWILKLTVFNYVRLAPQTAPDWRNNAVIIAIGLITAALGVMSFSRRDLTKTQ